MNGVGAPWLVFVTAATVRWERAHPSSLPRPGIYVGAAVVYAALGLMAGSESARPLAVALGWAFVVAELVSGDLIPGAATGTITTASSRGGTSTRPVPGRAARGR